MKKVVIMSMLLLASTTMSGSASDAKYLAKTMPPADEVRFTELFAIAHLQVAYKALEDGEYFTAEQREFVATKLEASGDMKQFYKPLIEQLKAANPTSPAGSSIKFFMYNNKLMTAQISSPTSAIALGVPAINPPVGISTPSAVPAALTKTAGMTTTAAAAK